jgi:hypothetical protein
MNCGVKASVLLLMPSECPGLAASDRIPLLEQQSLLFTVAGVAVGPEIAAT